MIPNLTIENLMGYRYYLNDLLFCAKCNSTSNGVGVALTDNYSPMEVWELDDGTQPYWLCKRCDYEVTVWEAQWTIKELAAKLERKHDIKLDFQTIKSRPNTEVVMTSNITGKIIVNRDEKQKIFSELIGLVNKSLSVFAVSLSAFYNPNYYEQKQKENVSTQ